MNEYWAKEELARAYRCIAELWRCRMDGEAMDVEAAGYHAPVVAAAQHLFFTARWPARRLSKTSLCR